MKIQVGNIVTGVIEKFFNENDFIEYAKKTYEENEKYSKELFGESTIHFSPENMGNALEYIIEYCSDLSLTEE